MSEPDARAVARELGRIGAQLRAIGDAGQRHIRAVVEQANQLREAARPRPA